MKSIFNIMIVFGLLLITSCTSKEKADIYSAYKPVLMDNSKITTDLFLLPAQDNKSITLMRQMGTYLLALDYGLGIHVIDVSNPDQPVKKSFYQIPACIDFEVKGNMIYANNYRDFITIDFNNINSPIITKRELNAFDITIKTMDGLTVHEKLKELPPNTTIISYEKI
ncbi:MAG: hypothetical protein PSX81_12160 [bacterium]|nr:hypothetical protein [bacterium]